MAALPSTESDIKKVEKQEIENAAKAGFKQYRESMAEISLPTETVEAFSKKHLSSEKSAIALFLVRIPRDAGQTYQKNLQYKISEEYNNLCESNAKASKKKCNDILEGLCAEIKNKEGSYKEYKSHIDDVVRRFTDTPAKGIKEEDALNEFLKSKDDRMSTLMETDSKMKDSEKDSEETKRKGEMAEQERKVTKEEDKQRDQKEDDMIKSAEENFEQIKKKMEDDMNERIDDMNKKIVHLKSSHEKKMKECEILFNQGFKDQATSNTEVASEYVKKLAGNSLEAAAGMLDGVKSYWTKK